MMSELNDDVLLAGTAAVLLYIVILLSAAAYEVADKASVGQPIKILYTAATLYLVVYIGVSILQSVPFLPNLKKRNVSKTTAQIVLVTYLAIAAAFIISLFAYSIQPASLPVDTLEGNVPEYVRAALLSWHVFAVGALAIVLTKMAARKNPLLFLSVAEDTPETETEHKEADTA
jgi:cation transport ATPase